MGDPGKKVGLGAAVEILLAETVEERAAEQLALLPVPGDGVGGDEKASERAGKGRPAGSRNKSTMEMVAFIRARYPNPLIFLAQTYSRPVDQLAQELGCKKKEAFDLMVTAAKNLAPYMEQKQPVAVEITDKGVVQLVIVRGVAGGGLVGADGIELPADFVDITEQDEEMKNDD